MKPGEFERLLLAVSSHSELRLMMIFVFAQDDHGLEVFPTEEAAISYCEGIDVEEGNYLFWDSTGLPLEAVFTKANEHGRFTVLSGVYHLRPASDGTHLASALSNVSYLEATDLFPSVDAIKEYLIAHPEWPLLADSGRSDV